MRTSDAIFFGSGLAALVYQTVWARLLVRLLGSDSGGTAVVLAVFMGGMAAGSLLFGGIARRTRHPVRWYVGIEIGLALWAACSPALLGAIEPVAGLGAKAGVAALVLAGPTMLMGATFPLMGRLTIAGAGDTGRATSAFYGANTLGAAAGALIGPFVLMPAVGLRASLWSAAGMELIVALAAGVLLYGPPADESPTGRRTLHPWLREPLAWGALCMGFSALALEVLLTRLLVTVTGASIYAFAIVLSVFLTGIALGSRWIAPDAEGQEAHQRLFHRSALCVAPLTLLGLAALAWRTGERDLFGTLTNRMPAQVGILRLWAGHALLAALALLPPALAFGRALPSAVAACVARRPELEREGVLASVYAYNTLGALAGALAAAFLLLPSVGLRGGLLVALAASLLAAALSARGQPGRPWVLAVTGIAIAGFFVLAPARPRQETVRRLSLAHGPHASVAVEESDSPPVRSLRVNGKVVATTGPVDMRLQRLLGHIPGLLHGNVRRALVIGMGTGMTAGSLLDLPTLQDLEVVEISRVMSAHGAAFFGDWNAGLLQDPRTRVVIADGRHHMARSRETYDLITSDPIHPWTAGSSDLYAFEHFEHMRERLAPGGIASQWLPLYQLSGRDVRTVVATWCAAFPYTSAWLTAYDLVLVGAAHALPGPRELAQGGFPARVAGSLRAAGVGSPLELAALCVAHDAQLRAFAGDEPAMRDDLPVLEFRAPRSFLGGYCTSALEWAARPEFLSSLPPAGRTRGAEVRAALRRFLERLPAGLQTAVELYGAELLALPPLSEVTPAAQGDGDG